MFKAIRLYYCQYIQNGNDWFLDCFSLNLKNSDNWVVRQISMVPGIQYASPLNWDGSMMVKMETLLRYRRCDTDYKINPIFARFAMTCINLRP